MVDRKKDKGREVKEQQEGSKVGRNCFHFDSSILDSIPTQPPLSFLLRK